MKIVSAYFSPSNTTKTIVDEISKNLGEVVSQVNLLKMENEEILVSSDQLLVLGLPVFCGRIPPITVDRLARLKGDNTLVVAISVYGNRGFDDALRETCDILENNGFIVLSAGAFIAQHSIFTKIACGRPDKSDYDKIKEFCDLTTKKIGNVKFDKVNVSGNYPYKKFKPVPFTASANSKCNNCGKCVDVCPVNAIDKNNPSKTDSKKCISCTACIKICPQGARKFGAIATAAAPAFALKCAKRQEPEWFL